MTKHLHLFSLFLLSLLFALAGCGDPVVDPGYRGESLLTVTGEMRTAPGYHAQGPLHVAMVWFPTSVIESGDGAEVPDAFAMVAEDAAIEGSFPLTYRLDVFQPPPPEAMGAWGQGLPGRGAIGLVIAYEDLNGNGKLDRIPRNGAPQDRIVGASTYEPGRPYMVLYTDTAQQGVPAGFSIGAADESGEPAVLPASTKLSLTLTPGGDLYDALVCEAGWVTYLFIPVCGLGGNGEEQPPLSDLNVSGDVKLNGGHLDVDLRASIDNGTGFEELHDATLKLGGRELPFDATSGHYVLSEDASTLLTLGQKIRLEVSARGQSTFRDLQVPGAFDITAPGEGAHASSTQPLAVQWTQAAGATGYSVELETPNVFNSGPADEGALSKTYDGLLGEGDARVRVAARGGVVSGAVFESFLIDVSVVKEQSFVLDP
ncbi:hypothetical protein FGE12_04565 [Aggregicoccus sp. 17bor-14]|uniref:hypothetical protein n=1 Tax=Myxococcaceae TaxID=31 RepID=UPI00129C1FD9|nr:MULTISPECIES: hypothetical protein [Myxococcaceae]MBF5041650.1 hypothetical protein [Simulacricoccus sp. 17bor-14]MRI87434.1 hypothetical protein [Aggregicoccus sp. 17bor-14]